MAVCVTANTCDDGYQRSGYFLVEYFDLPPDSTSYQLDMHATTVSLL